MISDILYGKHKECLLDVDANKESAKTLVYLHGGGLEGGDKSGDKDFIKHLADKGMSVVSINYRMYPNAKFPDFIEDAASAVKWVTDNAAKYGIGKEVYVYGGSAGAYLAMMLCFDDRYLNKHGIKPTDLAGFIFDSPQPTTHFNVLRERGIDTRKVLIDEASPIYFIAEKPYPKMAFIVYTEDMFGRLEQIKMTSKTLEHFKVPHTLTVLPGHHMAGVYAKKDGVFASTDIITKVMEIK